LRKRARNFRHLLHDKEDREQFSAYGYQRFIEQYEQAAGISGNRSTRLRRHIQHYAPAGTF
jgi:hypothetical protein